MKNKLYFLIEILYLILSLGFIIINYAVIDKYDFVGIIFAFLFLLILKQIKLKNKKIKILIMISIIIKFLLIFLSYKIPENDYLFFYQNSKNFANSIAINNHYISFFPYLYAYIFLLGNVMKLFGTSYKIVIIVNFIFELLGEFFLYLLIKEKRSKDAALKSTLFYACNPLQYIWIVKCCPVIIVNTLLILVLYLWQKLNQSKNIKKTIFFSFILAIIISVANLFRPIMIIFIIAIFIYLCLGYFSNKNFKKQNFIFFTIIIVIYIMLNTFFNQLISYKIGYRLPNNAGGWSIFVGSNYESNGRWNKDDAKIFAEISQTKDNVEAQTFFQNEGLKRYNKLGIKTIPLIMKKSVVLGGALPGYTCSEFLDFIKIKKSLLTSIFHIYAYSYLFFLMIINIMIIYKNKKENSHDIFYLIFIIGLFSSMLLVEVSERYFIPILVPIMVYCSQYFDIKSN